jgi:hypothetical protein
MRAETARRASVVSLLVGGLALLTTHAPVSADTASRIAWDRCAADGGAGSKLFSCDGNDAPPHVMIVSFWLEAALPQFAFLDGMVEVQAAEDSPDPALPDWWQLFSAGACRQPALTADADFSAIPPGKCQSAWNGSVYGGIGAYTLEGTRRGRITFGFAAVTPDTLAAHRNYEACRLVIDNGRTSGPDACAGCGRAMCIQLIEVNLYTSGTESVQCPAEWGGEYGPPSTVGWNCGYLGQVPSPYWPGFRWACLTGSGCTTPVRNRTWGQIKAQYR